jgi:hypothetical protein
MLLAEELPPLAEWTPTVRARGRLTKEALASPTLPSQGDPTVEPMGFSKLHRGGGTKVP